MIGVYSLKYRSLGTCLYSVFPSIWFGICRGTEGRKGVLEDQKRKPKQPKIHAELEYPIKLINQPFTIQVCWLKP